MQLQQINKHQLYKGSAQEPRIPRYMSMNCLQAMLYGDNIYTTSINLIPWQQGQQLLGITENIWYLDHAYGQDSLIVQKLFSIEPGFIDTEVGEAIINISTPLQLLEEERLYQAIVRSYDLPGGDIDLNRESIENLMAGRLGASRLGSQLDKFRQFIKTYYFHE